MDKTNRERRLRHKAKLLAEATRLAGKECLFCGSADQLHFAHVLPTALKGPGRGGKKRLLDVTNNPDRYVRMCKACHAKFDALVKLWVEEVEGEPIPF